MGTTRAARSTVRRSPRRASYDREAVLRVLARECVAHVTFVSENEPFCIPMLYARIGNDVLVHAARSSRIARELAAGAPACLAVTVLDGLVLANSAFEHSVNYESVVLFGRFREIVESADRMSALQAFTDALVPGRWSEVRPPTAREARATTILALPIEEASVKARSGQPDNDDIPWDGRPWTGVIPINRSYGMPTPSRDPDDAPVALPRSVERLLDRNFTSADQSCGRKLFAAR